MFTRNHVVFTCNYRPRKFVNMLIFKLPRRGGGEAAAMGAHAVDGGTGGGRTAGVAAAATAGGNTGAGPRQGEAGVAQVANLAAETAQAMHPRGGGTGAVRSPATVGTGGDAGMATAQAPVEVTGAAGGTRGRGRSGTAAGTRGGRGRGRSSGGRTGRGTGRVESNTGGGAEEAWVSGENDAIEDEDTTNYDAFKEWVGEVPRAAKGEAGKHRRGGGDDDDLGARSGLKDEDTTNYDAFKEWVGEVPRAAKGEAGKHRRGGGDDDDLGARSGLKVGNKRQKGNKGAGRGRGASKGTARDLPGYRAIVAVNGVRGDRLPGGWLPGVVNGGGYDWVTRLIVTGQ
ncbi:hypothetical protein VOLCADRAFT_107048 [Volvox carteri f. nagariensis]|uniref:Uncharacterized protein n=1 Tax=Volvox carteri f. nagariensis TaxID=3068 RepID=D8UBM6_VOLCA|nr:uncharacterized protein VOLCADRAFT_107048 [Volvox carteri f. nagariensis]EFJ42796.1 hypothetical protein VOLCADRAFT_107048 [Volvox carteri f. nagariensis]|eukprot:XP_002956056.1 hypothetical protein VOLCADRAFT_107048 [Volvox carteri f. nagariensis]